MTKPILGAHPNLEWAIEQKKGVCAVSLIGELDLASCDQLESALSDTVQQAPVVIFNLGGLMFIDSTGLRLLIRWRELVLGWGGHFLLTSMSAPARRLLQVANLTEWFEYLEGDPPEHKMCPVCDAWIPNEASECGKCGAAV
jgi:anti-anti-sigma factor